MRRLRGARGPAKWSPVARGLWLRRVPDYGCVVGLVGQAELDALDGLGEVVVSVPVGEQLAVATLVATWVAVSSTWVAVVVRVAVVVGVELEVAGVLLEEPTLVSGAAAVVVVVVLVVVVVVLVVVVVVGGGVVVVAGGVVVVAGGVVVVVVGGVELGAGLVVVGVDVDVDVGFGALGVLVVGVATEDGVSGPAVATAVDGVGVPLASGIGTSPSSTVWMTRPPWSSTRCGTTAYGTDALAEAGKPRYGAGST
ncbi:hypothetical protein GCM10009740_30950 [Terrabacter terrae]|uniref:Uncharacterized protein n=1 Tax=Terrabacter terrae TaxID=318434 RepID=A0ABN2UJH4_9MICO